jgi:hypothetical protein
MKDGLLSDPLDHILLRIERTDRSEHLENVIESQNLHSQLLSTWRRLFYAGGFRLCHQRQGNVAS